MFFAKYSSTTVIGLNEINANNTLINISNDGSEINISSQNTISRVEVFDLFGRKIYSDVYENNSIELETFSFPDFIILRIFLNDSSIFTKKIILK